MTTTPLRTAAVTGAVLLLTLTACSAGGGGDGGSDGGTSAEALPKGPLDELLEEMDGGEDAERIDRQLDEVEEVVAACMREQGFEYTPVDWSQQPGTRPAEEPEEEWGTLAFAERYGYGATTNPYGDAAAAAPEEELVDPNQAYVEQLSEAESAAYQEALHGTPPEGRAEDGGVEVDVDTAGCQGRAQREADEVGTGMDVETFDALQEAMDVMWQAVQDDPRMAEVNARWAACMADAGYAGLAMPADAENVVIEKANAVYDEAYAGRQLDETSTEEDVAAVEAAVRERLAEITDEEIRTAVADHTCRDEVDLPRTQAEVGVRHQQEFYDAHEAELEAWREAISAQG